MEVLRDYGRFRWYRLKKDAANCGDCRYWRNVFWTISDLELIKCLIAATAPDIIQFKLSDIGEGIAEVVVKEWWVGHYHSVNQSIKLSINRKSSRSFKQSIIQSINQSFDRSIKQSINQSINQTVKCPSKNNFRLVLRFFSYFFASVLLQVCETRCQSEPVRPDLRGAERQSVGDDHEPLRRCDQ